MIKVWILMIYFGGTNVVAIDNIASQAACQALGQASVERRWTPTSDNTFRCFEVEKINHPARLAE